MLLLSAEVTIRCDLMWCDLMWYDMKWCDSISNHIKFMCCILSIPFPCRSDIRIILKYLRKDSFILLLWYFFWELFFEFLPPVVSHLQEKWEVWCWGDCTTSPTQQTQNSILQIKKSIWSLVIYRLRVLFMSWKL